MHKYFNFTKIYEAEQMGEPLDPQEMGTPGNLTQAEPVDKLKDFSLLAKENILEITLNKQDFDNLNGGESVSKEDAKWKNKENETKSLDIKLVILNSSNEKQKNDAEALVFNLDETAKNNILKGFGEKSISVIQVLTGTAQDGTVIPEISVKFIKSVDLDTSTKETVVPASPEQIESGVVMPDAVVGEMPNESRGIMSFDQFINEGKKKWSDDKKKGIKKEAIKKKSKKKEGFPDVSGDGVVTKKDILIAKGVIKK
jgi:hypothetical protein